MVPRTSASKKRERTACLFTLAVLRREMVTKVVFGVSLNTWADTIRADSMTFKKKHQDVGCIHLQCLVRTSYCQQTASAHATENSRCGATLPSSHRRQLANSARHGSRAYMTYVSLRGTEHKHRRQSQPTPQYPRKFPKDCHTSTDIRSGNDWTNRTTFARARA